MPQWFEPYDSEERGDYIRENVHTSGAFLMGRTTYEMLGGYWSTQKNNEFGIADRLNSEPKYVVSTTLKGGDAFWNPTTIISDNVVDEIRKLKEEPGKDLIIFGSGTLVESLMDKDVIDEYRILVQPIVAGGGKRFFKDGQPMTGLKLLKSATLPQGVTLLRYVPARVPAPTAARA
jgi:dihydrofolate reductase